MHNTSAVHGLRNKKLLVTNNCIKKPENPQGTELDNEIIWIFEGKIN